MVDDKVLPIVIVGHVDHGKSTLIGRLLYDTGSLPQEKALEIEEGLTKIDSKIEFAYLIDYLEEERTRSMTIDTSQIFFKTSQRRYVVIDTPGHKEFLKNMITGSSQAAAALLIIDGKEGIQEQTRRHGYILRMLGLEQVCVLVNKMDLLDYSQSRFKETKIQIELLLNQLGVIPSCIIPISAENGDNIAKRSSRMDWYRGATVVGALDNFSELAVEEKALRFPVQDIYKVNGERIVVGRIESGSVYKGQEAIVLPRKEKITVAAIKRFMEDGVQTGRSGECIGLILEGDSLVKRGEIIMENSESRSFPTITKDFEAKIFWMGGETYTLGTPLMFRCVTQEIPCSIIAVYRRFDPAIAEIVEENPKEIRSAEVAEVEVQLEKMAVLDYFNEFPETGRFVLEQHGQPVAGGVIM